MSLTYRRAVVVNAYDVMAVDAFLRASGLRASHDVSATSAGVEEKWVLSA